MPSSLRVSKHTKSLEFRFADEIEQFLEARFGFAGKADDEGRAQCDARHAGPDFPDEIHDVLPRGFAPHPFEHVFVDVLERNVHVTRHLRASGDGPDEFVRPVRGMGVKQADPEIACERIQFAQQRADGRGIGRKRFRRR